MADDNDKTEAPTARRRTEARSRGQIPKSQDLTAAILLLVGLLTLDLGLARGISYYTGVIFELILASVKQVSLGGGGRYDGLVKALGGDEDAPAMGFAYNLSMLVNVLDSLDRSDNRLTVNP